MLRAGCSGVALFDADRDRAEQLCARLTRLFPLATLSVACSADDAVGGVDGIVQTTPIGMEGHAGAPLDPSGLVASQWLADVIYFPRETELVRAARANGLRAIGSTAMFINQAALAFAIFTGAAPDRARMRAAFR
jgi:shikimate dehydrogenase